MKHTFSSYYSHTRRQGGEGKREGIWRFMSVYGCVIGIQTVKRGRRKVREHKKKQRRKREYKTKQQSLGNLEENSSSRSKHFGHFLWPTAFQLPICCLLCAFHSTIQFSVCAWLIWCHIRLVTIQNWWVAKLWPSVSVKLLFYFAC